MSASPQLDLDTWTQVVLPGPASPTPGFTVTGSYLVTELDKKTVYDVVVVAENEYGLSPPSAVFNFYNKNTGRKLATILLYGGVEKCTSCRTSLFWDHVNLGEIIIHYFLMAVL